VGTAGAGKKSISAVIMTISGQTFIKINKDKQNKQECKTVDY
jgi:replication-associated recombination protein RarA